MPIAVVMPGRFECLEGGDTRTPNSREKQVRTGLSAGGGSQERTRLCYVGLWAIVGPKIGVIRARFVENRDRRYPYPSGDP